MTAAALRDPGSVPDLVTELTVPFLPYPFGLLVDELVPLLGLMPQIDAAHDDAGSLRDERLRPYVAALEHGLRATLDAVEASGLKHNEVWSYRIAGDRLQPVRWGNSSDVQLWNLTNLVVELERAHVAERP